MRVGMMLKQQGERFSMPVCNHGASKMNSVRDEPFAASGILQPITRIKGLTEVRGKEAWSARDAPGNGTGVRISIPVELSAGSKREFLEGRGEGCTWVATDTLTSATLGTLSDGDSVCSRRECTASLGKARQHGAPACRFRVWQLLWGPTSAVG